MINTYDVFKGKDLEIAELIQQRRLQILIHSRIYYNLNQNIISDKTWDKWARELQTLQNNYPLISRKVRYYEAFKDWDASTGAFLPLDDEWVVKKAGQMVSSKKVVSKKLISKKPQIKKKKKLF